MVATHGFGKLPLILALFLNLSFLPSASGNWKYKSRPDLSPPTLNITTRATLGVFPGYIFVAPYSLTSWDIPTAHGPLQPAPYIFTPSGELVWSGFGYFVPWAWNFQTGKYKGEDVLFAFEGSWNTKRGHSHGHVKFLNKNYEAIKEVRFGNHGLLDLHEFQILDGKTALVESYRPVPLDLKKFNVGSKTQWIVDATFQEVDIETGRLLFEWSSLDHVLPNESILPISTLAFGTGHNSSDAIDYFHINSIDRDSDHNYLISARHTSTIYKINGTTGSIIWRLGGPFSNFTLEPDVEFGLQHHARVLSHDGEIEIISLFDNSGGPIKNKPGVYENKSSGKIISLSTKSWTASLVKIFPAPEDIFAATQGSTQILANGNAFVNWGSAGAITEFSPDGDVIFNAYLESGELWRNSDVENYRGFRFEWTGTPEEQIAVAALGHGESIMVYVSWNGDTETRFWRFFGVERDGKERLLGEEVKNGFETGFYVRSGGDWRGFWVEAVGSKGGVLRKSRVVGVKPYIYEYVPGRDDVLEINGVQMVLENFEDKS